MGEKMIITKDMIINDVIKNIQKQLLFLVNLRWIPVAVVGRVLKKRRE